MKPLNWQVLLRICLLVLSALFYFLHYLIFRDAHHIFIYLIGDVAFVFIEVLLVTLIIHSVLEQREKKARLEKLNMVIGVFIARWGPSFWRFCPSGTLKSKAYKRPERASRACRMQTIGI